MTFAMLWTVPARVAGQAAAFEEEEWYHAGMDWAVAADVSDGTHPNDPVTRE